MSEDGQSFTAEFTIELTGEGAPPGEFGPGPVTGTRINVEPMGSLVVPWKPSSAEFDLRGHRASGHCTGGTTPTDSAVTTTTG